MWLSGAPGSGKGIFTNFVKEIRGITADVIVISDLLKGPQIEVMNVERLLYRVKFLTIFRPSNQKDVLSPIEWWSSCFSKSSSSRNTPVALSWTDSLALASRENVRNLTNSTSALSLRMKTKLKLWRHCTHTIMKRKFMCGDILKFLGPIRIFWNWSDHVYEAKRKWNYVLMLLLGMKHLFDAMLQLGNSSR